MSNPTSNFGWQMPTATDLVTDLPADFEVFGQAVDTDFADLNGGTTGQILSKTSATDLDFTWVTPNAGDITGVTAGTGISGGGTSGTVTVTNSMATAFTTSGDLIQATGSGTFARLGTGTSGQYLTTNGTTNSWGSISAGSLTLLSTTSLTGATTTISSIDQTYVNLFAIISSVTNATGNGAFRIAPNNQTTVTSQSMIIGGNIYNRADNYLLLSDPFNEILGSGNNENIFTFTINDYTSASKYKTVEILFGYNDTGNNHRGGVTSGYIRTTSAITSLVFSNSAGNLSTGTVLLYGVK